MDRSVPSRAEYAIYENYSTKLVRSTIEGGRNLNKFYIIQVLTRVDGSFAAWNKWGRVGEEGEGKLYPFDDAAAAIASFEAKFKEKTKNSWSTYVNGKFERNDHYYGVVETDDGESGNGAEADAAPLGKLSEAQIGKGKAVLERLKEALSAGGPS